jgi:hypothetical protein
MHPRSRTAGHALLVGSTYICNAASELRGCEAIQPLLLTTGTLWLRWLLSYGQESPLAIGLRTHGSAYAQADTPQGTQYCSRSAPASTEMRSSLLSGIKASPRSLLFMSWPLRHRPSCARLHSFANTSQRTSHLVSTLPAPCSRGVLPALCSRAGPSHTTSSLAIFLSCRGYTGSLKAALPAYPASAIV